MVDLVHQRKEPLNHPLSNGLMFTISCYKIHSWVHKEMFIACVRTDVPQHLTSNNSHLTSWPNQIPTTTRPSRETSLKGLAEGVFGGMPCCTRSCASEAWKFSENDGKLCFPSRKRIEYLPNIGWKMIHVLMKWSLVWSLFLGDIRSFFWGSIYR